MELYNPPLVDKKNISHMNSLYMNTQIKLIENFLQDELPAATKLVLLNTLYFNQKWKNEFDEEATRNQTFYKTKENKIQVPMMHKTSNMQYANRYEGNPQYPFDPSL